MKKIKTLFLACLFLNTYIFVNKGFCLKEGWPLGAYLGYQDDLMPSREKAREQAEQHYATTTGP